MMKQNLTMFFIGAIAFICIFIIITTFDPFQATEYIKVLFYASLAVMVWSGGTIVFLYLKPKKDNNFESAFKNGLLLSIIISAIFLGLRIWAKI